MKELAWTKLFGMVVSIGGLSIAYLMWVAVYGSHIPWIWYVLTSTVTGGLLLDWVVTSVYVVSGGLAAIYASERRSWRNTLFGLPLLSINIFGLCTWWGGYGGYTDTIVMYYCFSFTAVANCCAAIEFLLRTNQVREGKKEEVE